MTDDTSLRRRKWLLIAGITLPLVVAGGAGWYLHGTAPKQDVKPAVRQPPAYAYSRPLTLAVAERRGRCRALSYHLTALTGAKNKRTAEVSLKAMGLLAGEMMNGYPAQADATPAGTDTMMLPAMNTPDGRRGLEEARTALLGVIHQSRGLDGRRAAAKVSESCLACHTRFMRNEGRGVPLLNVGAARK